MRFADGVSVIVGRVASLTQLQPIVVERWPLNKPRTCAILRVASTQKSENSGVGTPLVLGHRGSVSVAAPLPRSTRPWRTRWMPVAVARAMAAVSGHPDGHRLGRYSSVDVWRASIIPRDPVSRWAWGALLGLVPRWEIHGTVIGLPNGARPL
jgi:hypothetical protein